MSKRSLIDDVNIGLSYSDFGPPICFTNIEIRKMLTLVKAGKDDVIWDLGCGWGQTLIIAVTEFGVKKCFGIERLNLRYQKANERVRNWSLSKQITIIKSNYEDIIDHTNKTANLEDATIVLFFLESDAEIIGQLSPILKKGCRFVYHVNCLFPEIKPDIFDYPFCISKFPFRRSSSELDWLMSIIQKRKSSLIEGKQPNKEELWDELFHDYHLMGLSRNDVRNYRHRLKVMGLD